MIPVIFHLGPLPVNSFGLLMVLTFLAGWRRLELSLKRQGEDPAIAERMVFWGAFSGFLGARILYLITYPGNILHDPIGTIFSSAGFIFYGGFIGGVIGVWLVVRPRGKSFLYFADVVAPCLAVGYAVGRIGCHLSGDGDYGIPSSVPWAVSYAFGVIPTPPGVVVHPAPVYETLLSLVTAFTLVRLEQLNLPNRAGGRFAIYLVMASVSRFLVEFIRNEPKILLSLTQAQWWAIAITLSALGVLIKNYTDNRTAPLEKITS